MFSSPKDTNEWKSVNANEMRNQTSVNVNRNVNMQIGTSTGKIQPRVLVDNTQGKVVDARQQFNKRK